MKKIIEREAKYYTAGYHGDNARQAPFYLRALVFDGEAGEFNTRIVDKFNNMIQSRGISEACRLTAGPAAGGELPSRIIVVNASHDNLPTSYETARVFEDYCAEKGHDIPACVVNTRAELEERLAEAGGGVLVMSQCVDKNVYNTALAVELEKRGVVTVPGPVTAPGSVFSDKDSTYRLLSGNGRDWSRVARYRKISVEEKSVEEVVGGVFDAVDDLARETGDDTFFVKPHEGGGGLGGFRVTRKKGGYIIPDLSKVSGDVSDIHPTFIDFDVDNEARLRELLWIYRLFAGDPRLAANYIKVDLPIEGKSDGDAMGVLRDYLAGSGEKRRRKLDGMVMSTDEAHGRLTEAVRIFEKKFKRRYTPLVNEHLDFGLWGLRAHYRLSKCGAVLETIYHRVFQLGFTEEGLGYLGADNISNKQTGELEIKRLGPLNPVMLASIGGEEALFSILLKGAEALAALAGLEEGPEKGRVPLRLQLDLAAVSGRIGEGNADTARGLCLASRWPEFVRNAGEWLEDSLSYYAWKKGTS